MEEKHKIHAVYILSILILIIIILIAVQWYQIPNLAELITFSLTITSLVLAVLAIAYAIHSNSSLSQTINTINNISDNISKVANQVFETTENLKQQMALLPNRLDSMEGKVEQTHNLLQQFSVARDLQPLNSEEQEATGEIVDVFFERSNFIVLLATYICASAYKNNAEIDMLNIKSIARALKNDFFSGTVMVLVATGLININRSKSNDADPSDILKISDMNGKLLNSIHDSVKVLYI